MTNLSVGALSAHLFFQLTADNAVNLSDQVAGTIVVMQVTIAFAFQLIGGFAQDNWVLGGGWAGNIKNAGFKGELSWFHQPETSENSLAVTTNVDYAFEKGLYLNVGGLYNSRGQTEGGILQLFTFELSAQNLYPYRWASFVSLSYPVSPIINAGFTTIYSPVASHALFVNPTCAVSISDSWNIDLVGQIVFDQTDTYSSPLQALFLRVKWAY